MDDSVLVYSTDSGRVCSRCQKPAAKCRCKKKKAAPPKQAQANYPDDGVVRIRREVKGRKGKTVTAVFGLPFDGADLKQFAKELKKSCGSGGSIKDGTIVIQGDHRESLRVTIAKQGYTVKIAGG
jgi:translation initiation factor 1